MNAVDLIRGRPVLIFDLDGTLVDTTPMHARAFTETLSEIGITEFDYSEYAGQRTDSVIRSVLERANVSSDGKRMRDIVSRKQKRAVELIESSPGMLAGAREFVTCMQGLGKRLAISTSASRNGAIASLKVNGIDGMFEIVTTGDDVARAKPAPDVYEMTLARLETGPSSCVVFEDSEAGFTSAKAAGIQVIVVTAENAATPAWAPGGTIVTSFAHLAAARIQT